MRTTISARSSKWGSSTFSNDAPLFCCTIPKEDDAMKHEFVLEGLHCANCAAKIENKLNKTEGFDEVRFSFATLELDIESDNEDIRGQVQQIVDSIESGVTVVERREHHHEHHHEHGDHHDCCEDHDGHNHGHDHGHDHEHNHGGASRIKLILLVISAVLFAAAFVMHLVGGSELICNIISVIAAVLAGWDVAVEGVKSIFKRRIDETTLMTVAVIAAMVLGEFVEAAAVMVLFGIGEYLEDKAVEKSRRDISRLADIRPDKAYIYENGSTREVPAEEVGIDTVLQIPPHTRVPLDGVIIEGETTIDASSLTGESEPVYACAGTELLSGMINNDSAVIMRTTKEYSDSAATRIVKLVEDSAKNKSGREKLITRFAAVYTPVMIGLAVAIAVIPSLITGNWAEWIHKALVCLVASCPCSIVISVPLSYYAGIGAAGKAGALIKGGRFVEALAAVKAVALDKTGTLTDNRMTVGKIIPSKGYDKNEVVSLAASAEARSAHPIAEALRSFCEDNNISVEELNDHNEISGFGVSAARGEEKITVCRAQGIHGVSVRVNNEEIGVIEIAESIRPEAAAALSELKKLGVERIAMLSGDNREACDRAALGLPIDEIHGSLLPEDKVETVGRLMDEYGSCCFVGDGINDAPVLSRSDCGTAMGLGSEAALEAADIVLSSGTLSPLPRAVRIARSTVNTVKANITFSLAVKAVIIVLAILNIAPLWLAVLADTGVCMLCVLNSVRLIAKKRPQA